MKHLKSGCVWFFTDWFIVGMKEVSLLCSHKVQNFWKEIA